MKDIWTVNWGECKYKYADANPWIPLGFFCTQIAQELVWTLTEFFLDQFSRHSCLSGQYTPVFQKEDLPKIKSIFISVFLCEIRIFRKSDFTGGCMIQCNLGRITRSYIYSDENVAWSVVNMLKVVILPSYLTVLFPSGSSQIKFHSPPCIFFFFFCFLKCKTRHFGLNLFLSM